MSYKTLCETKEDFIEYLQELIDSKEREARFAEDSDRDYHMGAALVLKCLAEDIKRQKIILLPFEKKDLSK